MVASALTTHFSKQKHGKVVYRNCENLRNKTFRAKLDEELSKSDIHLSSTSFQIIFTGS